MHDPHGTATSAPGVASGHAGGRNGRATAPRLMLRREVEHEDPTPPAPAEELDWRLVGTFVAGITLGALLGAATALLLAPATGFETRTRLRLGARRAGERASEQWDDLEDAVKSRARRSRRSLERRLAVARWRAQDAWERKRYGNP